MQQEINKLRNELKNTSRSRGDTNSQHDDDLDDDESEFGVRGKKQTTTQAEIKILKQIIKTIEEKSVKEKNMLQKQLMKKKQEIETLKVQINDMKMKERNLRNELRTVTNELSIFRKRFDNFFLNFFLSLYIYNFLFFRRNSSQQRSSSLESSNRQALINRIDNNDPVKYSPSSYKTSNRVIAGSGGSRLYSPAPSPQVKHNSRRNSRSNSINNNNSFGRKSLSPSNSIRSVNSSNSIDSIGSASSSRRRFNPTEYVKNKKMKLQEIEMKK